MNTELEFVLIGLTVVGVWVLAAVAACGLWCMWNRRGPTPKPDMTWKFKYTETAPPARGRFPDGKG